MGLDKWIKTEEEEKKPGKKKKDQKSKQVKESELFKAPIKLSRYVLICTKAKCKYQKTIMKKVLEENDKICPKCKSKMKIK
ncbi:MAG: hypothetical protein ACFE85_02425 [Candidatus Hodarchaeota archaeon]